MAFALQCRIFTIRIIKYVQFILGMKEGENRRQGTVTLEGGDLAAYGAIEGVEKFTMTGGKADLSYGDDRCVYACLLYTSPSPRD